MKEYVQVVLEPGDSFETYLNWKDEIVVEVNGEPVLFVHKGISGEFVDAIGAYTKKTTAATVA